MTMVKPGHTSLNMSDISEDLKVEYHHVIKLDPQYREDASIDKPVDLNHRDMIVKADDVDLVNGVNANKIAVAIDENHRDTVNNALKLNGFDADHYMSADVGGSLANKTNKAISNFGKDITDLRNELYEIKHALEKQGLITNTYQRMGYNDVFRNGYKPYEHEPIGEIIADCPDYSTVILSTDSADKLDTNDYIAIYFVNSKNVNVRQIKEIQPDGETIILDESMDTSEDISLGNVIVYKSMGVSQDGNFYFAKQAETVPSDIVMYTGFDDDTAADSLLLIQKDGLGYANTFRIPEKKLGFLHDFSVMAEVKGTPTLTCVIIDAADIKYFKNPEQALKLYESGELDSEGEPKMHFFAKSNPVSLTTAAQRKVTFDFFNSAKDSYPIVSRKDNPADNTIVRYCAMIFAQDADKDNAVKLYAVYNRNQDNAAVADIQTRNILYKYGEQIDTASHSALYSQTEINKYSTTSAVGIKAREQLDVQAYDDNLDKYDMYYEVSLREPIENQMIPYKRGLYSARIKSAYPEGISRARLMLRFNREGGCWNAVATENTMCGPSTTNGSIKCICKSDPSRTTTSYLGVYNDIRKPIEKRDPNTLSDLTMKPNMIIGNNITSGNNNGEIVTIDDNIMVTPDDMVYRNAYVVSVKGKKYEYSDITKTYEVVDSKKIYLEPVAVIRDGVKKKGDTYSDRIIFEGDFTNVDGDAVFYNDLELQIYWEESNFSEIEAVKQTQMGIIHDLVFSTDRGV